MPRAVPRDEAYCRTQAVPSKQWFAGQAQTEIVTWLAGGQVHAPITQVFGYPSCGQQLLCSTVPPEATQGSVSSPPPPSHPTRQRTRATAEKITLSFGIPPLEHHRGGEGSASWGLLHR